MILTLNNDLRLVGNEHAWEMQKRRTRGGRQTWESIKYYRKLRHALVEAGERQVRLAEGNTLSDVIDSFTSVTNDLQRILDTAIARLEHQADNLENRSSKFSSNRPNNAGLEQ